MISLEEVEVIHKLLISKFGGSQGIRDLPLLESAINRPFQTFDQMELYPTPIDKAAALFESLIINHPFIDGNKRTAYVLMSLLLLENQIHLKVSGDEKYSFVISASKGELKFDQIKNWISSNSGPLIDI